MWGPTVYSPQTTRAVCSKGALYVALGALLLGWADYCGCAGRLGWLLAWLVAKPCLMWRLVAIGNCGGSWHSCLHCLEVLVLWLSCCWAGSGHTCGFTAPGLVGAHWLAEPILGWLTVGLKIPRAGVSLLTVEVMTRGVKAAVRLLMDGLVLAMAGCGVWDVFNWCQLAYGCSWIPGWLAEEPKLSWNYCQPTGRQIHVLRSLLIIFSKLLFFCLKSISLFSFNAHLALVPQIFKFNIINDIFTDIVVKGKHVWDTYKD